MAGILSGLKSLGLDKLEGLEIFEDEEKKGLKIQKKAIFCAIKVSFRKLT